MIAASQLAVLDREELALPTLTAVVEATNHGAVFTRRWMVEFVLDLAGYTADRDLAADPAVEPACGTGAFLVPMVDRLLASCAAHDRSWETLDDAIRGYDLLPGNVQTARSAVATRLQEHGVPAAEAVRFASRWISQADYLLDDRRGATAAFVIGNPPYIRLEEVPESRQQAYRRSWSTMGGRADVYVGFYEKALRSLRPGGVLAFICADRWMRNAYGTRLRELVASEFAVETVVEVHNVDAFEEAVSAYPAITVIRREAQGEAIVAETTAAFREDAAHQLTQWARDSRRSTLAAQGVVAARLSGWFTGPQSWPAGSPDQIETIADLERRFPLLEDAGTGTQVGIGVATGADSVFVTADTQTVERERLLPLALARDIRVGTLTWSGHYLVDPWTPSGLVDLDAYPLLQAYFTKHKARLRQRHVTRRRAAHWYRTIDRVDHRLTRQPKLLFADLGARISPVLDDGSCYPHHNLYWITSDMWDLRVLGGLLLSDVANLFISTYCVRMRGGTLRFQAQYLRRIRVPRPVDVGHEDAAALRQAFDLRDAAMATEAASRLYGLGQWQTADRDQSGPVH